MVRPAERYDEQAFVASPRKAVTSLNATDNTTDRKHGGYVFSLSRLLVVVGVLALAIAYARSVLRLRQLENELSTYRVELGYLEPSDDGELAASKVPFEEPLKWEFRVRVPEPTSGASTSSSAGYRLAYSTLWEAGDAAPSWFAALPIPPGESKITLRILRDPGDDRWKVAAIVQNESGTRRIGTVLPEDQVSMFRGSHERLEAGIGTGTVQRAAGESLRLLDQRWLVGEGALLLYGDRAPVTDLKGVFAELQPDQGPL
ncbi:MAG: hypothetical protein AAF958_13985 [Planctomycetota bacterium]